MNKQLSHLDSQGRANMVNVGDRIASRRIANAYSRVSMLPETLDLVLREGLPKGDVLSVARVAGIMAAKNTSQLIPLCHPLNISSITVEFKIDKENNYIEIKGSCEVDGKTGVEMEALVAVSVTALTIYDMCKAVDRSMVISDTKLTYKSGGKSEEYKLSNSLIAES